MTTVQTRAAHFREEAAKDYPASWRPDQGAPNPLVGEVVRYDEGPTDYGPKLIVVVRDDSGKEWVCVGHPRGPNGAGIVEAERRAAVVRRALGREDRPR